MKGLSCSCHYDPRPITGRQSGNGMCLERDEVVQSTDIRYVFTGAAVRVSLCDVSRLSHLGLDGDQVYIRTDRAIMRVRLRSLSRCVKHFACAGFFHIHAGLYVHLRHLALVEVEGRSKRLAVRITEQEVEWLRISRRQLAAVREWLGLPSRSGQASSHKKLHAHIIQKDKCTEKDVAS